MKEVSASIGQFKNISMINYFKIVNINLNRFSITIVLLLLILVTSYNHKTFPEAREKIITYTFINLNGQFYDTLTIFKTLIEDDKYFFIKIPRILTMFNPIAITNDTSYAYYLFNKNDEFGFFVDSLSSKNHKAIHKDSFLTNQFYIKLEKIDRSSEVYYTFHSSYKEDNMIVRKYYLNRQIDSSYSDTALYYFNESLKYLNFSLDKHLDSINNSKLIKKTSIYYNKNKEDAQYGKMYREISVSFELGKYIDKEQLIKLISNFELRKSIGN